ncbi:hypothetical protein L1987_05699 [Smallanthus sonchifolius]|uniref:Uncharacterized protein n=1 Tax=Smallanthus sonchifolius TaxID=185202 RepID=A0ACB9JW36_9ASTR|nr:hypothetical protein L1987_05699 [Smallanthus sonchifolius]
MSFTYSIILPPLLIPSSPSSLFVLQRQNSPDSSRFCRTQATIQLTLTLSSFVDLRLTTKTHAKDFVRLDQDILSPFAGKKQLYTYETMNFWEQIKTPAMSLKCSALYLAQFRHKSPGLLAYGDGTKNPTVVGDVCITLMHCIILDDAEIQFHSSSVILNIARFKA